MRRTLLLALAVAAVAAPAPAVAKDKDKVKKKDNFPETIALPNGLRPEGIATGRGSLFYVGSIPTGAVLVGDLRTGMTKPLVPGMAGSRAATGLKYDHGRLWVSGAGTGKAFVYDATTGGLIREYQLAPVGQATFVNDVIVTNKAAYFTDSQRPVIYRVALGQHGEPGDFTTINLTGDYQHAPGFNLNGIEAVGNGKTLLAVQSATGKLLAIDPSTGVARNVNLGSLVLTNGDGLLLHGRTLYVVQNQLNKISVLRLSHDLSSASLSGTITDSDFDVPTTVASFGKWLYAVNARFTSGTDPSLEYKVVQVRR